MTLYVSLVPDSSVVAVERYGAEGPGIEGSIKVATFSLGGLRIMCSDSPVHHAFTPSNSLFVTCASDDELERLAAGLGEGGQFLMPLDNYGFSRRFGWLNDRFGVSWQLNLE